MTSMLQVLLVDDESLARARLRTLLDMIGIDDQCLVQFARGARELRQDQHAEFIVARSDEFFRYQVHAVMQ